MLLAACTSPRTSVDDLRGQSFDSAVELIDSLRCDGQWRDLSNITVGQPPVEVSDSDGAVELATDLMGDGDPEPGDAFLAGRVWVLIDRQGRPFGGLEPDDRVVWCGGS